MNEPDTTDAVRTHRCGRVAVIAGISPVVLIIVAVGIYVGVSVLSSPMMGDHANEIVTALIMVHT